MNGRNNVVLIELVIVILFFALSSTVTLRLFSGASERAARAEDATDALLCAQDWAERIWAAGSEGAELLEREGWTLEDGAYTAECEGLRLSAALSEEAGEAGTIYRAQISARDWRGNELISLPVARYLPQAGA